MFVPGYRFAHSGSPLRGTIEAGEFSPGAWETAVDKARFPARVLSASPLRVKSTKLARSALGRVPTDLVLTGTSSYAFRLTVKTDAEINSHS